MILSASRKPEKRTLISPFSGRSAHPPFDSFEYQPSMGASGGILAAWKSSLFLVSTFSNSFAITMDFSSTHDNTKWVLTCVYAPCTPEGRTLFLNWFKHIHMPAGTDWIILGDFNLIRKSEDRNRPGGDLADVFSFNAAISQLGITEIVLQGRKYTWSNMQPSLLEKLDWVFTSSSWALTYPSTSVKALDMIPSDHCPCIVNISTQIPRNKIFRFKNFWLKHPEFQSILLQSWNEPIAITDKARLVTAKLKRLRKKLRDWQASLTNLKTLIANVRGIIFFLEILTDYRDLGLFE